MKPIVAITMGDPCGVGPEIIVKAFDSPGFPPGECSAVVIGDALALKRAIDLLGSSRTGYPISGLRYRKSDSRHTSDGVGVIPILGPQEGASPELSAADIEFGKPSPSACEVTLSWIRTAVELVAQGVADAVCTCPINKEQLHRQGFAFPGHTEFIRELTGADDAVMMLCGPRLRVALATIHEPLADVPALITKELLRRVIRITAESLERDFAVKSPRIAVAGLNPHAGEAGRFGRAEIEVIRPVVEEFGHGSRVAGHRSASLRSGSRVAGHESRVKNRPLTRDSQLATPDFAITGPWPADTVFHRAASGEFDAVVAMYHDQGLIPIKLLHFNEAVNVTLGLPIVRTSVDHGTAYDIAGSGTAEPGSLIEAVRLAAAIARNRRRQDLQD